MLILYSQVPLALTLFVFPERPIPHSISYIPIHKRNLKLPNISEIEVLINTTIPVLNPYPYVPDCIEHLVQCPDSLLLLLPIYG